MMDKHELFHGPHQVDGFHYRLHRADAQPLQPWWQRMAISLFVVLCSANLLAQSSPTIPGFPSGPKLPCPDPGMCFVSQQAKDQWAAQHGCLFVDETLALSGDGNDLLKGIEKLRLKPYDDQTGKDIAEWVKGATVGYGHLVAKSEWDLYKDGITEDQANQLFDDDLAPFVKAVNDAIIVSVTQQQFDAMVILAFNIGITSFNGSSVVKLVNDPDATTAYDSLEDAWKAWNKSQGEVNQGLINRRNAEWNIYTNGVYERW